MTFIINQGNFYLNGKKTFLNSGEIHYFRIKRDLWDEHLSAAREAGLMAVSSYVPWAWHEETEGLFDFSGRTLPELDLEGWLERCKAHGLYCILKPGPFILAETRGAGIPYWMLNRYGNEIKMHDREGQPVASDGLSLFHPVFLEKVSIWYDHIMPLISKYAIDRGGPVILMQVCNEIGVFSWLAHQGDYSSEVRARFIGFLKNKFSTIDQINLNWGTDFRTFEDIVLPPDGRAPFVSPGDRSRDYEWHCFWRKYYGDYLRMLAKMARDRGVNVPFYHNLPGWIYGSGYEFPVNITMYEDLFRDQSEIVFGVDHIPEYLSHRNMHDDRIINDITRAMQGDKPLFAAEFQCGSREFHVETNPRELELFYKASLAHGLTGWNYYMFSQGRNPRHRGYSGSTFYWFTPLTPEAERTTLFPLVSRMSKLLSTSENIILDAQRKAETGVLFYAPYYATELERPETGASGLVFNYAAIRRPAFFDGLLKALQVLNVDYDVLELCRTPLEELSAYKQVWAFCTDEMNAEAQQTLAGYVLNGGNLVIFPNLPDRELSQQRCTILRDAVSLHPGATEVIDSPLIDLPGLQDIKCANPQVIYTAATMADASALATTINGNVCGVIKKTGKGQIIHLGTWLGYDTEGHLPAYTTLLNFSGAKLRHAGADNRNLSVRQRFTNDGRALLFISNYYNEEQKGKIWYTHPKTREIIPLPYDSEQMTWPPLYGVLTPVGLEITNGISILHSTSDLLKIEEEFDGILIQLMGDRDLTGEIVLEGERIELIADAFIDDAEIMMTRKNGRLILTYRHSHKVQQTLKLWC